MTRDSAISVALRVARAFESHGVPYAIGGAIAYGYWAVPRGTLDVDVNVFVEPEHLAPVFDALESVDVERLDRSTATRASEETGLFVVRVDGLRLDVFTPSIPFSRLAGETRCRVTIDGQDIWVLSAESTCVFKLLFFRTKDLADIEQLLAVRGTKLDRTFIREHLVDMMGEDDERVRKWDELVSNSSIE